VFTRVVRLRSGANAESDWRTFRADILTAIEKAGRASLLLPADSDTDVEDAKYAVVSFVDTMVMTSGIEEFEDWQIRTLQHELFGMGKGGVDFFVRLSKTLKRQETQGTANLLELYLTCLELGFEGREGAGELLSLRPVIEEKIKRIRRQPAGLSPAWRSSGRNIAMRVDDTALRRAAALSLAVVASALVLYLIFRVLLGQGASAFADLVGS
jgi:type IV/VI secretion system ImpK/VasF family protein